MICVNRPCCYHLAENKQQKILENKSKKSIENKLLKIELTTKVIIHGNFFLQKFSMEILIRKLGKLTFKGGNLISDRMTK